MASGELAGRRALKGGQLGGILIPEADSVTIGREENKLNELRDKPLLKVCAERVLVHLNVHRPPTLMQMGRGTESEDVIVGVFVTAVGGGARVQVSTALLSGAVEASL